MRYKRPGDAEHPRVAGERAVSEFGQFSIEARWQIDANFANLLFDDVIIIEQPLSRGRNRATRVYGGCDVSIGGEQNRRVVVQSRRQRSTAHAAG